MAALFPDYPEAVENTVKIAELCNMDFQFGVHHLPEFKLPEGYTDGDAYFQKLCEEGFARRYPGAPAEYRERLAYEMGIIRQMGFVDYFLIVSDFIGYAKRQGHPRGPRPGLGGRLHGGLLHGHHRRGPDEIQPLLRALPQPRAGHHAGY